MKRGAVTPILFTLLFVLFYTPHVYAAVRFLPHDFWEYERIENDELRGGRAHQLNTRPLVIDDLLESGSRFVFDRVSLEYANSDNMPQIEHRQGKWIGGGDNLLVGMDMGFLHEDFTLWIKPEVSWHENQEYSGSMNMPEKR